MKKILQGLAATVLALTAPAMTALATPSNPLSGGGSSIESSGFFSDVENLVNIVIAVGGFWVLVCLVIAGMKLSGSSGNPQKRTEGLVALGFVAVGGFIIVKAYDIAGWIASFGMIMPISF
ncbi:pilin [Piscibacillus sp. B03]|uniref:pilin n=1 Tax=Piscibacillus sp. B03 TaxID=3457430 RepID=UPI003FCDAECD